MKADRPIACITFIGDPSADTRILRTALALSEAFEVHIIALTHRKDITVDGAVFHLIIQPEGKSLRTALFGFWKTAAGLGASLGASVYVASDLYSLPAASRAAKAAGGKLVYDSRELYSAIAALQTRRLRQRFWNIVERRYAPAAAAILTVNEPIADILRAQYPSVPVHASYNVPIAIPGGDIPANKNILREAFSIPAENTILISNGGLQKGRGLFEMIALLERLPDCHLVFLGDGPLRSELELFAHGSDCGGRVHFKHVASQDVLRWTAGANIGLCFVENLGLSYYLSLPNKFFEYMHAGIPSVCTDLPVVRGIIEEFGNGVLFPEGDTGQAVLMINKLRSEREFYKEFAASARNAAVRYSWEKERERLRGIFRSITTE